MDIKSEAQPQSLVWYCHPQFHICIRRRNIFATVAVSLCLRDFHPLLFLNPSFPLSSELIHAEIKFS